MAFLISPVAGVVALDPHPDPHADRTENGWIPPGRKFQPFFSFGPYSHDLVHEISHLFGGLLLLLAGGVGVGAEGETGVVVTYGRWLYGLSFLAHLSGQRGVLCGA